MKVNVEIVDKYHYYGEEGMEFEVVEVSPHFPLYTTR